MLVLGVISAHGALSTLLSMPMAALVAMKLLSVHSPPSIATPTLLPLLGPVPRLLLTTSAHSL